MPSSRAGRREERGGARGGGLNRRMCQHMRAGQASIRAVGRDGPGSKGGAGNEEAVGRGATGREWEQAGKRGGKRDG